MLNTNRTQRLRAIGALAVATAGAAAVLGPGAAAQAPSGARTVAFSEIEKATPCCIADVAPRSPSKGVPLMSPGDALVYTQMLRGADAKRLGKLYGTCTAIVGAPIFKAHYLCDVVYSLTDGTISVTGLGGFSPTSSGAVTGGTGAYANARGTFFSKSGKTKTDTVITLVD